MTQAVAQGWSAYIPAIITGSCALLGAFLGQVLSHQLTRKRDKEKANLLTYEKLLAPIATDIFGLLQASTAGYGGGTLPRYQSEDDRDRVWNEVIEHMQANVSHAYGELLRVMLLTAQSQAFGDLSGHFWESKRLRLAHAFMVDYYDTLRRIYPRHDLTWVVWYRYKYRLLTVLSVIHGPRATITQDIMSLSEMISTKIDMRKLKNFEKGTEPFLNSRLGGEAWTYLCKNVFSLDSSFAKQVQALRAEH